MGFLPLSPLCGYPRCQVMSISRPVTSVVLVLPLAIPHGPWVLQVPEEQGTVARRSVAPIVHSELIQNTVTF